MPNVQRQEPGLQCPWVFHRELSYRTQLEREQYFRDNGPEKGQAIWTDIDCLASKRERVANEITEIAWDSQAMNVPLARQTLVEMLMMVPHLRILLQRVPVRRHGRPHLRKSARPRDQIQMSADHSPTSQVEVNRTKCVWSVASSSEQWPVVPGAFVQSHLSDVFPNGLLLVNNASLLYRRFGKIAGDGRQGDIERDAGPGVVFPKGHRDVRRVQSVEHWLCEAERLHSFIVPAVTCFARVNARLPAGSRANCSGFSGGWSADDRIQRTGRCRDTIADQPRLESRLAWIFGLFPGNGW